MPLFVLPVACGDDSVDPSDGGGGGGAATSGSVTSSSSGSGASGGGGAGPACGDAASVGALERGAWDDRFTIGGVASQLGTAPVVFDFATDVDGSVIAAGRFDSHAGEAVPPLLRWRNDAWEPARTTWEIPPPEDGFSAVAVSDAGALALATNTSYGVPAGEIWLDDGEGLVSIGAFDGLVRRMAFFDGALWVAGNFALEDGSVSGLAVWNGTAWTAPPGGAVDGPVYELLLDGESLLVGGSFTAIGGTSAANVAAWDGAAWSAYPFTDALTVYALARHGGELYAGGAHVDYEAASGLARWTGAGWETVGGGLGQYQTRAVVTDIASHDGVLDVTGCFNSAGGLDGAPGASPAGSFARWSGDAWQTLDDNSVLTVSPWHAPFVCGDEGPLAVWDVPHQALGYDGARLLAGGRFAGVAGIASQSLIAHDGDGWVPQGEAVLGVSGSIDKIAAGGDGCQVYGVGTFTHVSGEQAAGHVVHFDGQSWQSLADDLTFDTWCPDLDVSESGEVAVGCMIFPPDGDAEGIVLRRQGDAMVPMAALGLPPIMAVAWSPSGTLWVGGAGASGYLARIDGGAVQIVVDDLDGPVLLIDASKEDDVVFAGSFKKAGSKPLVQIGRWDGSTATAVGDGLVGSPTALRRGGETIYASTYDDGEGAYLLGAFDGTSWKELATEGSGVTKQKAFNFNAIRVVDGSVIAGGAIELDDGSGRGVAVYRDGAFTALAGGVSAIGISDLAIDDSAVWVAGTLMAAGPETDPISSVGVARLDFALSATSE